MSTRMAKRILNEVLDCVAEIDTECNTLLNKVEHGLINVKLEFQDRARIETGKTLTEETLIAWLIWKKMRLKGRKVSWEFPYPTGERKKCDLLFDFGGKKRLWLELKLASKAWFNCEGKPVYHNSLFNSYLYGTNRTHSFRHDLEKLGPPAKRWSIHDQRAVCLIGFDCVNEPMDEDVCKIAVKSSRKAHRWTNIVERHSSDRRHSDFRINTWCWLLDTRHQTRKSRISSP